MIKLGNFSETWCPDCGSNNLAECPVSYTFSVRARHPETGVEHKGTIDVEHIGLKCGVCKCIVTDYRGEEARFIAQRDWTLKMTGIEIDKMGNRIN